MYFSLYYIYNSHPVLGLPLHTSSIAILQQYLGGQQELTKGSWQNQQEGSRLSYKNYENNKKTMLFT
jgi:hypothetical protein